MNNNRISRNSGRIILNYEDSHKGTIYVLLYIARQSWGWGWVLAQALLPAELAAELARPRSGTLPP